MQTSILVALFSNHLECQLAALTDSTAHACIYTIYVHSILVYFLSFVVVFRQPL